MTDIGHLVKKVRNEDVREQTNLQRWSLSRRKDDTDSFITSCTWTTVDYQNKCTLENKTKDSKTEKWIDIICRDMKGTGLTWEEVQLFQSIEKTHNVAQCIFNTE